MIDLKLLRENPNEVEKKLQSKDPKIKLKEMIRLDESIRFQKKTVEDLKSKRNQLSKEIGYKKKNKEDVTEWMEEVQKIGEKISEIDEQLKKSEKQFQDIYLYLPNLPFEDILISQNVEDNQCIKIFGEKPVFDFPIKNHLELNEKLHLFDFKRGAKVSGAGWPVYTNQGATLEWALINYMIDIHKKNGFQFILPPLLAKPEILQGSAHLPKFEDQLFQIHDEDFHLYLIPTSEAILNGLHYEEILAEEDLPIKYVCFSPCFRREAGSAGVQERGLIRTHQFNKVELFSLCKPEESSLCFEQMLASAEEVLQGLELHYRNSLLVTSDMSFASAKTIDIEAWLPGQDRFYEVSSVSNCTDFQARRSLIRFKSKDDKKPSLVHTLNGSGVATSRLMVSFLETHQQKDGSVKIPKALSSYLKKTQISNP